MVPACVPVPDPRGDYYLRIFESENEQQMNDIIANTDSKYKLLVRKISLSNRKDISSN